MQLHFDAGDYVSYHPELKATSPHDLNSGVNARRARIGLLGKFAGDWDFHLRLSISAAQDPDPAAIPSAIENGYVTYNGFIRTPAACLRSRLHGRTPFTLDEATSSNDILFMERFLDSSSRRLDIAGDFRSAFGVRSNNGRYWAGVI